MEEFLDALEWFGIDFDEGPGKDGGYGPYFQSQRGEIYKEVAQRLLLQGKAYHCYCTPEELEARRQEALQAGRPPRYDGRCRQLTPHLREAYEAAGRVPVIRLMVPETGQTVVHDLIRGEVVFEHQVLDDFVIVKSDGTPTYNFACAVDDAYMAISHVIRGEEHLSNTPKQLLVLRAAGLPEPAYAHVPMVLAPDRSRLSKRHGATSVAEFRAAGFLPEALLNYLILLGWMPEDGNEILTLAEAAEQFSLERVQKNAAIYDIKKLTWMNGVYLRKLDVADLWRRTKPFLREQGVSPEEIEEAYGQKVVALLRERASTLVELAEASLYFFTDVRAYDPAGVARHFTESAAQRLRSCAERLGRLEEWTETALDAAYTQLAEELNVSRASLIHPTRLAVTGRTVGPGLFEVLALLGRDTVVERLSRAAEWVEKQSAEQKAP